MARGNLYCTMTPETTVNTGAEGLHLAPVLARDALRLLGVPPMKPLDAIQGRLAALRDLERHAYDRVVQPSRPPGIRLGRTVLAALCGSATREPRGSPGRATCSLQNAGRAARSACSNHRRNRRVTSASEPLHVNRRPTWTPGESDITHCT